MRKNKTKYTYDKSDKIFNQDDKEVRKRKAKSEQMTKMSNIKV